MKDEKEFRQMLNTYISRAYAWGKEKKGGFSVLNEHLYYEIAQHYAEKNLRRSSGLLTPRQ
jgi:hypothetical protein